VLNGQAPTNSELRKIADDTLKALKMSFASVAADPEAQTRERSLEAGFQAGFQAMSPKRQELYKKGGRDLGRMSADLKKREFGRYAEMGLDGMRGAGFDRAHEGLGNLSLDEKLAGLPVRRIAIPNNLVLRNVAGGVLLPMPHLAFEEGDDDLAFEKASRASVQKARDNELFDDSKLKDVWGIDLAPQVDGFEDADDAFDESAVLDKLGMWITRVKCVDETNPEWWGDDEFAVGGASVDENGDTLKINEIDLGGGWHDGRQKSYSNWRFHWFNLKEGKSWPKTYHIILLTAEKDNGGFSDFLDTVYQKVRDTMKDKIEKWVGTNLEQCLGKWLAEQIGKAVAWIVDTWMGWIISWWQDDPFPAHTASMTHGGWGARWTIGGVWGSTTSAPMTAHFYGHGGHYLINYYWKLFT
jgi:hypothetical protein